MLRVTFTGLLSILIISCSNQQTKIVGKKQNQQKLYKFYDFNLSIDIINPIIGIESKYFYINSGATFFDDNNHIREAKEFKPYTLYYVEVFESLNRKKQIAETTPHFDTLMFEITKPQIDTIYSLTAELFKLNNIENVSNDSIPRPPKYNDGYSARIELDLGFRGNKYITYLNYGDTSEYNTFSNLYKHLLTIKNSH